MPGPPSVYALQCPTGRVDNNNNGLIQLYGITVAIVYGIAALKNCRHVCKK